MEGKRLRQVFDAWSRSDDLLGEKEFEHVVVNVLELALTEEEIARVGLHNSVYRFVL